MQFYPLEFERSLIPDLYFEWIEFFERFFEIKDYYEEKAFTIIVLKLKKYASLWYEITKR